MRNTPLLNLRQMLKAECHLNMDAGVAVGEDKRLNIKLANMQQWLWTQHKWPFLYTHDDVAIGAVPGARFYNFPAKVSFDYPTESEVQWTNIWTDVDYGIKGDLYSVVNPDLGQTLDPVQYWQNYSPTQFEVWPPPSTNQVLRFWGTGNLTPLQADGDLALLDDLLIVLFTGAALLQHSKQQDAQEMLVRATTLFNKLKGANRPDMVFTLGGREDEARGRRNYRLVGIIGNPNH